jgi:hypothetical protein
MENVPFGDDIKPIVDSIANGTLGSTYGPFMPSMEVLDSLDLMLLAYSTDVGYNKNVLMYYLGRSKGFSRLTALPNGKRIITLKEIAVPALVGSPFVNAGDGAFYMVALCEDSNVYVLFQGTQDGTVIATAVTQPLPTPKDLPVELWDTDKTFNSMYVEGADITNFMVSFSLDGGLTFNTPRSLTKLFRIGQRGKSLTIKFTHAVASVTTPMLSYVKLWYDVIGNTAQ